MHNIDLTDMFEVQSQLDSTIAKNHGITYASTRDRRILSLLVEIGELANATRCFKYWSNKPSESKERVLDEYADGMHFFLSLGVDISTSKKTFVFNECSIDPTLQFHKIYHLIDVFKIKQDEKSYLEAFQSFIDLVSCLGFSWQDARDAYYLKLDVNYKRQENNY